MKTLSTVLREENITKRADILEFIRNSELVKKNGGAKVNSEKASFTYSDSKALIDFRGSRVYASDLYVVTSGGTSIDTFNDKIKKLDERIKSIEEEKQVFKNKIKFLEESGAEKFVENEYRAYQAIQTINKEGLTDFEKAKVISKLIK
jgi:hypothetical protein